MNRLFSTTFLGLLVCSSIGLVACNNNNPKSDEDKPILNISETIPGKWLLATSDSTEWTTYQFKTSGQMEIEWMSDGKIQSGSGNYFYNDDGDFTGSYIKSNNKYVYLDWKIKATNTFQIDIEIYGNNGNSLLTTTSLYKVVGNQEIETTNLITPDYRGLTGTNNNSDFSVLDSTIASIDPKTGELEGHEVGATFVIFKTPAGYAALYIKITEKIIPFKENIIGKWVYDDVDKVWERDVFGQDGYFYTNWSRKGIYPTDGESAQGTYTIDESSMTIKISGKTPYGQKLSSEYIIKSMDKYSFYTEVFSGGDKVGEFYYQRLVDSIVIKPEGEEQPDYKALFGNIKTLGFSSHDVSKATVDSTSGKITGIAKGMTYINVMTNQGTAVIEVTIE